MPRVENLGPSVDEFCGRTGNGSSTWDVCASCYRLHDLEQGTTEVNHRLIPYNGDPDGEERGGNVDHPPYEDMDYRCELCGKHLTSKDD